MEKLLLIDGNSLLFRAYYATAFTNMMKTSYGKYTNAIVSFNNMITNIIEEIDPNYALVAFDTKEKTFRHKLYEDYKGHRPKAPDELVEQFETARELLDAMNIKRLEIDGYEADDLIGTLAKNHPELKVVILTSDQDMLQLVDKNIEIHLMRRGVSDIFTVDMDNFVDEYEITPNQVVDLKALMGDSADNIPGIPGIGKKTGLMLLKTYDTLENILENVGEMKGKRKENIENNVDIALLSKQLATINTSVDFDYGLKDYTLDINYNDLYMFYQQYEMFRQANSIKESLEDHVVENKTKFKEVSKISESLLIDNNILYFELTEGYFDAKIKYVAVGNNERLEIIDEENFLKDEKFINYLKSNKKKIVYDSKAIYHSLSNYGLILDSVSEDIMISSFLVDNSIVDWISLMNKYGKNLNNEEVSIENIASKANDLFNINQEIIEEIKSKEMEYLYYEIELPLTKILFKMEHKGIKVDKDKIIEIANKTNLILEDLKGKIYQYSENEFNINSPKQLSEVLFDQLELPQIKKRSTAIDILLKLQPYHPIIDYIIEYRKYQKLLSTYAEGLQKFIWDDNTIHTIYHQNVTQTGRLSSTDPNLQNISVRDKESREIRKAFIADDNSVLMAFDYSQIELRVLAHIAKEEKLIQAFVDNEDIHSQTAKDVFEVEKVTSDLRHKAKAVNFGIIYGISDYGLAEQLKTPNKQAKDYIAKYFATYPKIKEYMDNSIKLCEDLGYVVTIFNRRRDILEISSSNYMVREFGKRAAMNAPIQGSAADIIKLAMIKIDKIIKEKKLKSQLILQVHDELIFNVKEEEKDVMFKLVEKEMNNVLKLLVPLVSEGSFSKDWYGL